MANAQTRAHVSGPVPIPDPNRKTPEPQEPFHDDSDEAIETTPPISRKERRKQKKQKPSTQAIAPKESSAEAAALAKSTSLSPPLALPMSTARPAAQKLYPLLVCSIGNPGATYAHTLHSAGHDITSYIASVKRYQPFTKGLSGLVSRPDNTTYSFNVVHGYRKTNPKGAPEEDDWTFWQSTSLMNVSGGGVRKAWLEFSRQVVKEGREPRLVVVHDELEAALGKVSVKEGSASARGHNGLKSCQANLSGVKWWRIGVGIGRPESRDPDVVSRYVLRKMSPAEARAMEKASSGVVHALRMIGEGKK